uniref:Ig-like domain-containing protein n=1 Tax=Romanomermis culicivorax TaxID=13658 RepID=A0A915I2H0_ROMCU
MTLWSWTASIYQILKNLYIFSSIPMSTTVEGRRPLMLKGPVDAFIVRNHPASLSCRFMFKMITFSVHVFDSNHENKQGIDEKTGAVYLETRILVHKREVEQYFGSNGFTCECYAYSSSGQGQGPSSSSSSFGNGAGQKNNWAKSEPATIKIARHVRAVQINNSLLESPFFETIDFGYLRCGGSNKRNIYPRNNAQNTEFDPANDVQIIKNLPNLKKHFDREPVADRQPLGGAVHIPCLPPEGEPRPEVFWLKNDREIESKSDPNVIIAHDGALIIAVARLSDSGNYTCGARNVAAQRLSHAVPVTIYVDGGWSEWTHWTGSCPSTCSEYDHYANVRKSLRRQRYRQCIRPAPINGGRSCQGQSEQAKDCDIVCSIDGQWTDWSAWSLCERLSPTTWRHMQPGSLGAAAAAQPSDSASCQRVRRRRCDALTAVADSSNELGYAPATKTPVSCYGREALELKNCTDDALCHLP